MASVLHNDYEYMNEAQIHDLLKCKICRRPFIEPVSTSNGQRFCRACFVNDNRSVNPTIEVTESTSAVTERLVLEMLDAILVRCLSCNMENISRGKFQEHILRTCRRAQVQCTASDIKCPWIGPREELNEHFQECRFEPLRPVLGQIFYEQNQLKARVDNLETQLLGKQLDDVNLDVFNN